MKKLSLILITTLLLQGLCNADQISDCNKVVKLADKVIYDQHQQIETYMELSKTQTDQIASLSVSLNDKSQELSSWLHNPFVIGAIGIVIGGAGVLYLKK